MMKTPHKGGADGRIRTAYLLITNQLLYRVSYAGMIKRLGISTS